MLINELAKAVHENAVAHGWWDDEREAPEIIALIHSEWSEALEEARAGRPLAYIIANTDVYRDPEELVVPRNAEGKYITPWGKEYHGKPEGVAVELIDGCIRILDLMGKMKVDTQDDDTDTPSEIESLYEENFSSEVKDTPLPHTVAYLHLLTSSALISGAVEGDINPWKLLQAMALALSWVRNQGLDPLAILLEKHEFNKSRPYKHGKKF